MTVRHVPFLDLRITDEGEFRELIDAVTTVFRHGRLVVGPEVEAFERRVAGYCGRRFAVGVGSGSDALYLALRAAGVGPGDEVITTSLSWVATANAITLTGATPVFADIDEDLNIDPASVARLMTSCTRAILPVHFTGRICRMEALLELARANGLVVIEDAAQAFGAERHGRRAGSFGDLACFSMNAMKVLAACGDAGVVLTDREDWRERLVALRYNGTVNREICVEPALNARLDTMQAAILLKRLDRVDAILARRREIAAWYSERLAGLLVVPTEAQGERHGYYTYQVRSPWRDELRECLQAHGIESKIQHPAPIPTQPAYQADARGEWTRAGQLALEILCIPANEKLSVDDLEHVASTIERFVRQKTSSLRAVTA